MYTAKATLNQKTRNQSSVNLYYVFNIGNKNGFIITSADDINVPIIGHSDKGEYDINNLPENYRQWMQSVEQGMIKRISEGSQPSEYVTQKWNEHNASTKSATATKSVLPLVTTKWDQSSPYNNMTPVYNSKKTYTGCVATAMAQVMKFHEHPKTIDKNITIPGYTTTDLGINIGALTFTSNSFDWNNMTNTYNSYSNTAQENAVAKLMYYCGVSARMNYSTTSSGASSIYAVRSLVNYFDYDRSIQYKDRVASYTEYTDQEWINLLKTELDNGRPILYSATSPSLGGHALVCDGYNNNDEFHFNWGWSGSQDGYYNINAPLDFVNSHSAAINIKPNEGGEAVYEFYADNYYHYPYLIGKKQPFKLNCSVKDISINKDESTEIHIALYNQDDEFICTINFEKYTVSESDTDEKRCEIPSTVSPGTYKIKAVIKQTNGTYTSIPRSKNLKSDPTITIADETVKHSLVIRDLTPFSSTTSSAKANDEFSLDLSFSNPSKGDDFYGNWGVALVDENTQVIKHIISESKNRNLNTGYMYKSYTFSCKLPADIAPGNYKLMMCAKPTDENWSIVCRISDAVIDNVDFTVNGTTTGIDETASSNIKIYPNPVTDVLHIVTNSNILKAQIYNTNGNLIIGQENTNNIDVQSLNKGIYILKIETEEGASVHKINKQ